MSSQVWFYNITCWAHLQTQIFPPFPQESHNEFDLTIFDGSNQLELQKVLDRFYSPVRSVVHTPLV